MDLMYNKYPTLLFTSFWKDDAPDELPFEVLSEQVKEYLSKCIGFNEMFAFIAAKNTLSGKNSNLHFYIEDQLFEKIDNDHLFRNQLFRNFFSSYIKPKHGTLLFRFGGQYVYMLLSKEETKKLKKRDGRYISVSLFMNNVFSGFEEGYITDKGIQIEPSGHYADGMDIGGYISFVVIALAYAGDKPHSIMDTGTIEKIYKLV